LCFQVLELFCHVGTNVRNSGGMEMKLLTPISETVYWIADCSKVPSYEEMQKIEKLK